jgi:hypothetical protein
MSLVVALFLITVVATLAAFAVTVGANSRTEVGSRMMQDRALFAARSGLEWASYRAKVANACAPRTFSLNEGGLRGFRVNVNCQVAGPGVYDITSSATYGTYGAPGYVARQEKRRTTVP